MLTIKAFLIACPLVFLAGFVDSIAGGGGLISLPAYLLAGLPSHMAIATNKLSSSCGTTITMAKFIRERLVNFKLAVPTVVFAMIGSSLGAKLSLLTDDRMLKFLLLPVLCIAAFFVLNKKLFGREDTEETKITGKTFAIACVAAFFIGGYDGFYGPGTGTFLIIVLNVFARLSITRSNAQAKVINLTSNLSSLVVYIFSGNVIWVLGLVGALCNMAGNYLGTRVVLSKGSRITRPVILVALALLAVKIIWESI